MEGNKGCGAPLKAEMHLENACAEPFSAFSLAVSGLLCFKRR